MELPKNIVQIGKADPTHKVFVEDYVISYMKQWNKHGKRDTGIVLFGKRMSEGDCKYYFVYGASYMPGVEARMQYLTDDEKEDAEDIRNKYFAEHELIGWGELRGELPEGFYMYEQNKGFWVKGYACFFEKNDSMLNFMVTEGTTKMETVAPAVHKETTYTTVRESNIDARMEERNRKLEQLRLNQNLQVEKSGQVINMAVAKPKSWKNAVMVTALMVCVVSGLVLTDEEKRKSLEMVVGNVVATATKEAEKLKDKQVEQLQASSVTAEGNQTDAEVKIEQEVTPPDEMQSDVVVQSEPQSSAPPTEIVQEGVVADEQMSEGEGVTEPQAQVENAGSDDVTVQQEVVTQYVSYTIVQGDTLLSICREECGSESFLQQVCQLNNIENADDIKIGQIILLPE